MSTESVAKTRASQSVSQPAGLWYRLRYIGVTGVVVAALLSVAGWLLVMAPENNGSTAAAIGVLFMTAPVALARRQPILAVSVVALAAIVNGLLWDDIIRCGAAFPALLYITFAVGARSRIGGRGWGWPVLGLAIAFVSVVAQGMWDPALVSGFLPLAIPLTLACWGAGLGWAAIEPRIRN
jgi:hypothetical protein